MAKRAVLKTFLSDVLGLPATQAETDSCKIEHLISQSTGAAAGCSFCDS